MTSLITGDILENGQILNATISSGDQYLKMADGGGGYNYNMNIVTQQHPGNDNLNHLTYSTPPTNGYGYGINNELSNYQPLSQSTTFDKLANIDLFNLVPKYIEIIVNTKIIPEV